MDILELKKLIDDKNRDSESHVKGMVMKEVNSLVGRLSARIDSLENKVGML